MKAFTPTVASSNTSSSVKQAPTPSIKLSGLGTTQAPVQHTGAQNTGHSASQGRTMATPTHSYGNSTIQMQHEQRGGLNGIPHIAMLPKIGK